MSIELLKQVYDFFRGRKAYIVGIMMITVGYLQGDGDLILQGMSVCALRAGISNTAGQPNTLN